MSLADFISPWSGDVFRHIPADSPYSVTEFRFAGLSRFNRWNRYGEPTLYLASDIGVAVAELGRHLHQRFPSGGAPITIRDRLYRLRVSLDAVLDFCVPDVWEAVGAHLTAGAPARFLDRDVTRTIATLIRTSTRATAMRVPSVSFLDDLTRWSLVLFLEKLPSDPAAFVLTVNDLGLVDIG